MIHFPCSECAKALRLNDNLAGKKVKCPGCGKVVLVASSSAELARTGSSAVDRAPSRPVAGTGDGGTVAVRGEALPPGGQRVGQSYFADGAAGAARGESLPPSGLETPALTRELPGSSAARSQTVGDKGAPEPTPNINWVSGAGAQAEGATVEVELNAGPPPCRSGWGVTRSRGSLAPAAWGRCTVPATRSWGGR